MTKSSDVELQLVIKRKFGVRVEKVYQAWTDPECLAKWFSPTDEHSTFLSEIDLRVGGRYRIGIEGPKGDEHVVGGIYQEIDPMKKLVFTWVWEAPNDYSEMKTLVTVEFSEIEGGTELTLTHEKIPSEKMAEEHTKGWDGCLDQCVKYVEQG